MFLRPAANDKVVILRSCLPSCPFVSALLRGVRFPFPRPVNPGPRRITLGFTPGSEPFTNDFNGRREAEVKYWPTELGQTCPDLIEVSAI